MSYSNRADFPFSSSWQNHHQRFSPYHRPQEVLYYDQNNNAIGIANHRSFVDNRDARGSISSPVSGNNSPFDGSSPANRSSGIRYSTCSHASSNNSPEIAISRRRGRKTNKRYLSNSSSSSFSSEYNNSTNEQLTTSCSSTPKPTVDFCSKRNSGREEPYDISLYYDPTCTEDPWAEFEESPSKIETSSLKSEDITDNESL